jgi:hypothetical protein
MKGFIKKTVAGCCFSAGLVSFLAGCDHYRDLVDPCYPERYNSMARHSTREMLNAQSDKGHILEQTVWNWHFERDPKTDLPSERLNGAGIAVLSRISRTLPCPDFQLYVQNAQDILYKDGVAPEKLVKERNDLNEKRAAAIQRFMATQVVVHGGGSYQIAVHDFAPTSLPGPWTTLADDQVILKVRTGQAQTFSAPVNK